MTSLASLGSVLDCMDGQGRRSPSRLTNPKQGSRHPNGKIEVKSSTVSGIKSRLGSSPVTPSLEALGDFLTCELGGKTLG